FQLIHVDSDEYLLNLTRYIHLNPVKDGLVKCPEDWEFSSYHEYVNLRLGTLPQPQYVLLHVGNAEAYRRFVEVD
ncbi:MAG: transposase, partial [Cyanobacteria bacterium P01_C01_bin.70]